MCNINNKYNKNMYDFVNIFCSGISSKAEVLALRGTALLQHREMPRKLRDMVTEAVHVLWESCEFELWLFSHNLLECHEKYVLTCHED